jgi:hypothetical protein|tara:strand:- start:209 stop:727 length:519 start_codon:yes stop_codon:yes gene_type:complete
MQTFEEYYNEQMLNEGKIGKALATGALAASMMAGTAQGAIFNNNPGNIRSSPTQWNGEITKPGEAFERFESMPYGIRASARILRTYGSKYNIKTINQIIDRYAPPEDNNPNNANYARHVSNGSGFGVDEEINLNDPAVLMKLMRPIFEFENGRKEADKISDEDIQKGVKMAF